MPKSFDRRAAILDVTKPNREVRSVFQSAEVAFRKRIVIGNIGAADRQDFWKEYRSDRAAILPNRRSLFGRSGVPLPAYCRSCQTHCSSVVLAVWRAESPHYRMPAAPLVYRPACTQKHGTATGGRLRGKCAGARRGRWRRFESPRGFERLRSEEHTSELQSLRHLV